MRSHISFPNSLRLDKIDTTVLPYFNMKTALFLSILGLLISPSLTFAQMRPQDTTIMKPQMTGMPYEKTMQTRPLEMRQEKTTQLRDTKKQAVVEKLGERMNDINEQRTSHMSNSLTRLSQLTARIASKAAAEKKSGKDTSTVEASITSAQSAIQLAQASVAAQMKKEYSVAVSSDETAQMDVKTTITSLMTDLKLVNESVKHARDKVIEAARSLAKLKATTSPTASSSATL